MQPDHLIPVREFCVHNQVEITFIQFLAQQGLVETVAIEQAVYIQSEQLPRLEKFVRLHQELAIHPDDLDIVNDLLDRMADLQHEVARLQNRLLFYEQ
ncbi:hypothetical protein GCM10028819_19420 [Spirosoma humi]